jgi:hypothetical protein
MQTIRRYVVVVCVLVALGVTGSANAARRNDDSDRVRNAQSELQKQKENLKGFIAKVLDDLQSKLSWPPG